MNIKDEYVYLDEVVDEVRVRVLTSVVAEDPSNREWVLSGLLIWKALEQHEQRLQEAFKTREPTDDEWYRREVLPEWYESNEPVVMEGA